MGNNNWMTTLAGHYEHVRDNTQQELVVLFDIDGTILDYRYVIYDVLNSFDEEKGTNHFRSLELSDIDVRENSIDDLLERMDLAPDLREEVKTYYRRNRWSDEILLKSHRPFQGVMDVIRWFQLQPRTHVGLNTARPESRRQTTLKTLNRIGEEYKVTFRESLIHMNENGWDDAEGSKVRGIRYFQQQDYRIVAMVDNEPENLAAIDQSDLADDLLLLHADNLLDSRKQNLPDGSISGEDYNVTDLIQGQSGAEHVTFIYDGLSDRNRLKAFTGSSIHWGNFTVREEPKNDQLILRQKSFKKKPISDPDGPFKLENALAEVGGSEKGLLFDLQISSESFERFLDMVQSADLAENDFGFRIELGHLQRSDIRTLNQEYPDARMQLAVNFLSDVILGKKTKARYLLEGLKEDWNIDEFSIDWQVFKKRRLLDTLQSWGFQTNIRNVPNLEQFLKAALLLPDSITVDLKTSPLSKQKLPEAGKIF